MGGRYARSIYPIAFYTKSKIPDTVVWFISWCIKWYLQPIFHFASLKPLSLMFNSEFSKNRIVWKIITTLADTFITSKIKIIWQKN